MRSTVLDRAFFSPFSVTGIWVGREVAFLAASLLFRSLCPWGKVTAPGSSTLSLLGRGRAHQACRDPAAPPGRSWDTTDERWGSTGAF